MKRELRRRIKSLPRETSQQWPYKEVVELSDVLRAIDQLDEPEVLSQEWIDERAVYASSIDRVTEYYVHVDNLKELPFPKKDLPVVPKYVAEWIARLRDNFDLYEALTTLENNSSIWELTHKWYRMNTHKFVNAYLTGENKVEEEPLYTARLKVIAGESFFTYLRTWSSNTEERLRTLEIASRDTHEDYRHLSEFTEHELKVLGIWDSDQWVVEEVEE